MTAVQFLDHARQIDADIQAIDRRYLLACANHAHRETLQRLEAQRNDLARRWGAAWGCRPVEP